MLQNIDKKLILLVRYNKVTDDAFDKFSQHYLRTKFVDLKIFGSDIDTQSFVSINKFLSDAQPFDAVMVGDIFWPTGQNICRWCQESGVPCCFLQHGQWIYVENKKNPKFLPTKTFVFGRNVERECLSWPYGGRSLVFATGTPRYDNIEVNADGEGVYFGPPIIHEKIPSSADRFNRLTYLHIQSFAKAGGSELSLTIHPHYREGGIYHLKEWFPMSHFVDAKDDPLRWIQKSKVVLTHRNSTTVLDAIACGKRPVLMNFSGFVSCYPKGYFGRYAVESDSPENCVEHLNYETMNLEAYGDTFMSNHIRLGNASKRIDSIIQS